MTPGFHTSSESIKLEFIENEGSALIFKGEAFILRQRLAATASFLLQQAMAGGAVILPACSCWGAAQGLGAGEVLGLGAAPPQRS